MKTVYLAGGHRTDWRRSVIAGVPEFRYLDPTEHGLEDPEQYTAWDLMAVRQADVVLAYLEAANPSGIGLALEVGYASALGKHVLFVDEKGASDPVARRYTAIVKEASTVSFSSLPAAISYLAALARI